MPESPYAMLPVPEALAIVLAVLRRRRERKLELWQNRFADPEGKGESGLFPGIRTQTGEHPKPP